MTGSLPRLEYIDYANQPRVVKFSPWLECHRCLFLKTFELILWPGRGCVCPQEGLLFIFPQASWMQLWPTSSLKVAPKWLEELNTDRSVKIKQQSLKPVTRIWKCSSSSFSLSFFCVCFVPHIFLSIFSSTWWMSGCWFSQDCQGGLEWALGLLLLCLLRYMIVFWWPGGWRWIEGVVKNWFYIQTAFFFSGLAVWKCSTGFPAVLKSGCFQS